ncbi:MAG: helix-turn-helix domain-containing protein [Bacteroides sp.]|nr:helix-turn-helix domain-containing protein [Bacteroides sp.]
MSQEDIKKIADSVIDKTLFCTKEVLTAEETARYMGISKSYLYKLTMRGEIPHYKPMGKMCYFNRVEVEEWLQQNRCATSTEIADKANRMLMQKGGGL